MDVTEEMMNEEERFEAENAAEENTEEVVSAVTEESVPEEVLPEGVDSETTPEVNAETEEAAAEDVSSEETAPEESSGEGAVPETEKKKKGAGKKKAAEKDDVEQEPVVRPEHPEAAIEAILFATGNSVKIDRLAEILGMTVQEVKDSAVLLKAQYEKEDRGITIMELEDALQLGTKGEYYSYLMKLTKSSKQYSLSDTVIETLSIIAYKQPVTRAQIEQIRGVSCDHALNKLLEYDLVEEVGRLDAPGKPLLFGTTEQFLRSFGVKSLGDLPTLSPELEEDFKLQAEAEAAENLKVDV